MKGMKKLLSILMVLTLVLSLSASAFAATMTVEPLKDDITHDYEAYQIFSGTQDSTSDNSLASVEWGTGIVGTAFLTALQSDSEIGNYFTDCKTAADVAKALSDHQSDTTVVDKFTEIAGKNLTSEKVEISSNGEPKTVNDGYYLIKDVTPNIDSSARNETMLQVTQDVKITAKYNVPSSQKKVKEKNDTTGNETDWQDAADYDIGDKVPFQLKATVPADTTKYYDTYELVFHDKQSDGLTFDPNSVEVTMGGTTVDKSKYTVVTEGLEDGCTFEIQFTDIKTAIDGFSEASEYDIVVEYEATLNDHAVIGGPDGNTNESHITYSNDSNSKTTGKTPEDKVTVFTFTAVVEKVGEDGETALDGAGFTLLKKVPEGQGGSVKLGSGSNEKTYENVVQIGEEVKTGHKFDFTGLDSGEYILVESTVPAGYNKAADIEFEVKATYDTNATDPKLTDLKVVDSEGNVITQFTVKITPDDQGNIYTKVQNNKGATLPETGGIGTTIFYIAGAILVAGAVIILVTKRRVSGAEK